MSWRCARKANKPNTKYPLKTYLRGTLRSWGKLLKKSRVILQTINKWPPCNPTFPLFSYFSVVVCLRCLLHHILSLILYTFQENREFVFISIVQFMMSANSRICFSLQIAFVCLYITPSHYHHCANFFWRHWTYKMPVKYNLSSVWVRLSIFSQVSIIQY